MTDVVNATIAILMELMLLTSLEELSFVKFARTIAQALYLPARAVRVFPDLASVKLKVA